MAGIHDLMLKIQTIAGRIKRADEKIEEAKALRLRAESALESAKLAEQDAIADAAQLRVERDAFADRLHEEMKTAGEADVHVFYGGESAGSVFDAAPPSNVQVKQYEPASAEF